VIRIYGPDVPLLRGEAGHPIGRAGFESEAKQHDSRIAIWELQLQR
jgi:hypothetical protein